MKKFSKQLKLALGLLSIFIISTKIGAMENKNQTQKNISSNVQQQEDQDLSKFSEQFENSANLILQNLRTLDYRIDLVCGKNCEKIKDSVYIPERKEDIIESFKRYNEDMKQIIDEFNNFNKNYGDPKRYGPVCEKLHDTIKTQISDTTMKLIAMQSKMCDTYHDRPEL